MEGYLVTVFNSNMEAIDEFFCEFKNLPMWVENCYTKFGQPIKIELRLV